MSRRLVPQSLASVTRSHSPRALLSGQRFAHQHIAFQASPVSEYVPYDVNSDLSLHSTQHARLRVQSLASPPLFPHSHDTPLNDLERRIAELKEAPIDNVSADTPPTYSDHELIAIYEDLLAKPSRTQPNPIPEPPSPLQDPALILRDTVEALYAHEGPSVISPDIRAQYSAAIAKLQEIIYALETARTESDLPLNVAVLSEEQWSNLVSVCVEQRDGQAAETILNLIKRCGLPLPVLAVESAMALYADAGDIINTERFLATFVGPSPSAAFRDLHVKAHLRALQPRVFPTHALSVLHEYESRNLPAPQQSYTRLITKLISLRSGVAEAQAWDLFSHMRYVAHPVPDAFLYSTMIAACASRVIAPQPARALDLFAEMTIDKGIPPTAFAYTAAISACARSGEKLYVGEAFRLAKEMLDGHRDAYGNPMFIPDHITFCALLEGAKRLGDLAKVRWILAEIVAEGMRVTLGDRVSAIVVDEHIMTHVFHAYASYKPPFNRAATVLVDQRDGSSPSTTTDGPTSSPALQDFHQTEDHVPITGSDSLTARKVPKFTSLLPQSHAEVLSEASALFARILNDSTPTLHSASLGSTDGADNSMPHAFAHVQLTARLLNAYLSVHYVHALFDEGTQLYRSLFSELGVQKNPWTYVDALEHTGYAKRGQRKQALKFAREVWQEWEGVEEAWRRKEDTIPGVNARLVERAYTAMIRILSLTGNAREALRLVRSFFERYPPDDVKPANPKYALRSTRTVLDAPRPLVRLLSATEVPDDTVPPHLSFHELEALHHKLVAIEDRAGIAYLKYVCMSYAGALKRRKEATLHAKPVGSDGTEIPHQTGHSPA